MNLKSGNTKTQSETSRKNERVLRNLVQSTHKYLRRAADLPGVPYSLEYFTAILKRVYAEVQGVERATQVKTIGTYCAMVPEELIYAAGAIPVKLCSGSYTSYYIGDEVCPRDSCPLIKAAVGFTMLGTLPVYSECAMVVIPTSCDCKKKLAYMLAPYTKVVPLHVPTVKLDDISKENFINDLYALKNTLESVTGNSITFTRLKMATEVVARAQLEISKFYALKKNHPSVIKGTHAMMVLNSYAYDRADRWADAMHLLNQELEGRIKQQRFVSKVHTPRIMITGSPIIFPNLKIPLLIEELGGIAVADETCMGERGMLDPVAVTENSLDGYIRACAARYILPCTCPTFVVNEQRLFRLKQMLEDFHVDGVIYHVLRGCLVYDFEYRDVEEMLRSMNIPVLRVETDYNEEDVEQIRIRLEAFIEMIKYQKEDLK